MMNKIYEEEGFSGFFKGIVPSLILTLVPVIQFTSYEMMKKSLVDSQGKISNKNIVIISFVSKLLTILTTYPLMTIKTLYQANSKVPTHDIWILIQKMMKNERLLGFYKGLETKVVGSMVNNTILMFVYEKIQILVRELLIKLIFGKALKRIVV